MKKVFISHPFSNDPVGNKAKCKLLLKYLHKKYPNIIFISPLHLFSYMVTETPEQREEIMQICFGLIDKSHEVWSYGCTSGCEDERRYCIETDKPFFEKSYDDDMPLFKRS